jgi:transposase
MALRLRALTDEDRQAIQGLAHARTAPARAVERARIIWLAHQGRRVAAIAREVGVSQPTVRLWLKRFNEQGTDGLEDAARSGRPATYSRDEVGVVIAASLTDPQSLELPFASWTLDRLTAYLHEGKHLRISRSRIGAILVAEGLRWRTQETWFGERAAAPIPPDGAAPRERPERPVDPAFAEKRGPSSRSTPARRPAV